MRKQPMPKPDLTIFDRAEIELLIEKIETGEGVDREIDLAVVNLFSDPPYRWSDIPEKIGGKHEIAVRDFPEALPGEITVDLMDHENYLPIIVPKYCSSLDTTKKLIETRLIGRRKISIEFKTDGSGLADIGWHPAGAHSPEWNWAQGIGETPEKALLAAFLRAFIRRGSP